MNMTHQQRNRKNKDRKERKFFLSQSAKTQARITEAEALHKKSSERMAEAEASIAFFTLENEAENIRNEQQINAIMDSWNEERTEMLQTIERLEAEATAEEEKT